MPNPTAPVLHFADNAEAEQQRLWTLEYVESYGMPLKLAVVNQDASGADPVYREAPDKAYGAYPAGEFVRDAWAEVHGIGLTLDPGRSKLWKYGIEDERNLIVSFSTAELDKLHMLQSNAHFLIGGRLKFDGEDFVIESQHRPSGGYFTNTQISTYLVVTALRPRIRGPSTK